MQITLRAILAIAILASAALFAADQASAMPLTASALAGTANTNVDLITRVTMICGRGGCAQVFTKRVQHPSAGFARRAVPLAIPKTAVVLQPVNASK